MRRGEQGQCQLRGAPGAKAPDETAGHKAGEHREDILDQNLITDQDRVHAEAETNLGCDRREPEAGNRARCLYQN